MHDQYSDSSLQVLHGLSKQFLAGALPPFMKAGEALAPAGCAPSAFGDPHLRRFPCHTKTATWLSQLYLYGQHYNQAGWDSAFPITEVAERLEKAASYHNIVDETHQLRAHMLKCSQFVPTVRDEDYALVADYEGATVRRFPVNNEQSIKKSAASFYANRVQYPYAWRKLAALSILRKAMELDVRDIPGPELDYLCKAAALHPAEPAAAAAALARRVYSFPEAVRVPLMKAAYTVRTSDQSSRFDELCGVLDTLDRQHKQARLYARGVPMPEEILFTTPIAKKAAAESRPRSVQLTSGKRYDVSALVKSGTDALAALGEELAADLRTDGAYDSEKLASVLPTLPRDLATTLDTALEAVGVSPLVEKQAEEHPNERGFYGLLSLRGWLKELENRGGDAADVTPNFSFTAPLAHSQRVRK